MLQFYFERFPLIDLFSANIYKDSVFSFFRFLFFKREVLGECFFLLFYFIMQPNLSQYCRFIIIQQIIFSQNYIHIYIFKRLFSFFFIYYVLIAHISNLISLHKQTKIYIKACIIQQIFMQHPEASTETKVRRTGYIYFCQNINKSKTHTGHQMYINRNMCKTGG